MKTTKLLSLLLTATITLASCGDDENDNFISHDNGGGSSVNSNKNTSGPAEAQYRLEFPKLKGENSVVIVHKAILNKNTKNEGVNYCVEWDYNIHAQRWSCYQMYSSINYHSSYNVSRYSADNDGSLSSTCQYPNDPDLPAAYRFTTDPFKYSGFDHGHICPSADRLRATECNYQTFFITNMQPQYMNFNGSNRDSQINERSPWFRLETKVRDWVALGDTLYVCKGGTIDKSDNIIKYLGSGVNKIPVPKYFFVALLSKKGSTYEAIGFKMEHLSDYSSQKPLSEYAVSIDALEQWANIDFFCNLPDDIENSVEKSYSLKKWGLQ